MLNASLASGIYSLPPEVRSLDVQRLQERVSALETQYSEKLETYTESAPKVVLLRKQIEQARENLRAAEKNSVTAALDAAKRQELLKQQIFDATRKDAMNVNEVGIQYAVLKKEVETNEQVFKLLKQKSNEQELSTKVIANNYAVVDPPTLPGGPFRPKKDKILLVWALIGLLGGIVIALVLEQVDDKLRGAE